MEPQCSLPCSQEPVTGPYPEPDESSSQHSILFLYKFVFLLPSHLCLGLPSGLFLSGFPIKILYAFSHMRSTRPANVILHYVIILIILGE
jgi:hypothetical protein